MRKQINGLSAMIQEELNYNPSIILKKNGLCR